MSLKEVEDPAIKKAWYYVRTLNMSFGISHFYEGKYLSKNAPILNYLYTREEQLSQTHVFSNKWLDIYSIVLLPMADAYRWFKCDSFILS